MPDLNVIRERDMNLQMKDKAVIEIMVPSGDELQEMGDEQSAERYEPASISMDDRGMILDCSKSFERYFGYRRRDLVWHHVSSLFPELTEIELVQNGQFNSLLTFQCRCGKLFQAKNMQGITLSCNLSFVSLEYSAKHTLRLFVSPALLSEPMAAR